MPVMYRLRGRLTSPGRARWRQLADCEDMYQRGLANAGLGLTDITR